MPKPLVDVVAEQIYETLTKQSFTDWHSSRFEDHVTGAHDTGETVSSKRSILMDIKELFNLQ